MTEIEILLKKKQKLVLTVNEVKVMHIPPKPFRAREMKMSTERAGRKQKARHERTTAELQRDRAWPSARQGADTEPMQAE